MKPQPRLMLKWLSLVLVIGLSAFGVGVLWTQMPVPPALASTRATTTLYLPMLFKNAPPLLTQLCRYGVDGTLEVGKFLVNALRIGWYQDWASTPSYQPGVVYYPMVHVSQAGTSYSYTPSGAALAAAVAANPGATWQIGNEPDRKAYQDNILPELYAQAYHDAYFAIKALDPTAKIAAGSIVQPTPLRMAYLDTVLNTYAAKYNTAMPVDVWNIHAFILREMSCSYDPNSCWGADVPPGSSAPYGMLYTIDDNDNFSIFQANILAFRQWMAARGYASRPLIITEFGVQMPADLGFPVARVNAFMNNTFNWLSAATDATGYPYDGNRLVQRWAWYSLTDTGYNGWLFDPTSGVRTAFGDNYAALTANIVAAANIAPLNLSNDPPTAAGGGKVNVALHSDILNNGNAGTFSSVPVRFFNGNPNAGGVLIATDNSLANLDGCGTLAKANVTWSNIAPGTYTVYVTAGQNTYSRPVTIPAADSSRQK